MADNFRNKQWFKNMSQERKDELCKKFDINEKTLKHACRETDDGRMVIDVLRIDHYCHTPEEWDTAHDALKNHTDYLNKIKECANVSEIVNLFEALYNVFEEHTYAKYKESLRNDLLVKQTKKYVEKDLNGYVKADEEMKPYYAYKTQTHLRILLSSDLNIVK